MITGLQGSLESMGDSWVVIGIGGVSLKVHVPSSALSELGPVGSDVRLYTHLVVREEELSLYGFSSPEALRLFELLLSVSGIGPRFALGLLSGTSPEALAAAIVLGDVESLRQAPGIGRKTAERLIVDLRDKLQQEAVLALGNQVDKDTDVMAALLHLGYSAAEARQALRSGAGSPDLPLEERIRVALQSLARR